MTKKKEKELRPLEPVDLKQCQVDKPNGQNFMTLGGGHKMERCRAKPTMIATESQKGLDGRIGSMSLCDACFAVFQKQMPSGFAIFKRITEAKTTVPGPNVCPEGEHMKSSHDGICNHCGFGPYEAPP